MTQGTLIDVTSTPVPKGDTPSWFTPLEYFLERERQLFEAGLIHGPFFCDPCGHDDSPVSQLISRRGAGVVYTFDDDGLRRPWIGRVFANPPYDANTVEAFLAKSLGEREKRNTYEVVFHVPAWTDRAWWQDWIEPDRRSGRCVVWFERGRLTYGYPGNPEGRGGDSAMFPSALVVWPAR